jgi:hypothetical protein
MITPASVLLSGVALVGAACISRERSDNIPTRSVQTSFESPHPSRPPSSPGSIDVTYARLPLHFERNQGQSGSDVQFLSRGPGYAVFLTPSEAVLILPSRESTARPEKDSADRIGGLLPPSPAVNSAGTSGVVLRVSFPGANPNALVSDLEPLPVTSNYFVGKEPTMWRTNIPTYARVKYHELYPGIDLIHRGRQRQLEYDFIVKPGAHPSAILLSFEGMEALEVDPQGDLVLHVPGGHVRQRKPFVYQERDGVQSEVVARYAPRGKHQVGFEVAPFDTTRPLVIDPVVAYSSYLGGRAFDIGHDIAVDDTGSAYITGITFSSDFPAANPLQPAPSGPDDVFVAKVNAEGSALVYSTYLGGSGSDEGRRIAVDASGRAFVTGVTTSGDFPTLNASQTNLRGDSDAFVAALHTDGNSLVYSTYLGGSAFDIGYGIATDRGGNAYVTGETRSPDFPTASPFQSALGGRSDAFVAKLTRDGTLAYSTFLGGTAADIGDAGQGIAVDARGSAYVAGVTGSMDFPIVNAFQPLLNGRSDAFVTKLAVDDSALVYSTYLGGAVLDSISDVAVNRTGHAYVAGSTNSADFPLANPFQPFSGGGADGFVAKLNRAGSALVYSSYLGGSDLDDAHSVALDSAGNFYIAGRTASKDFPTASPVQKSLGGLVDAFLVKVNKDGSAIVHSTYLGGSLPDGGLGIAVDKAGTAYIIGQTFSTNFPVSAALQPVSAGSSNAFIAKLSDFDICLQDDQTGNALQFDSREGGFQCVACDEPAVGPIGRGRVWRIHDVTVLSHRKVLALYSQRLSWGLALISLRRGHIVINDSDTAGNACLGPSEL